MVAKKGCIYALWLWVIKYAKWKCKPANRYLHSYTRDEEKRCYPNFTQEFLKLFYTWVQDMQIKSPV